MGRPRGGKVSSSSDATTKVDEKSKAIVRTSGRERKELMQSYVEETSGSEKEEKEEEEVVSNFEESLSESVSEPESSGSEYGVKKKKGVLAKGKGKAASPAKGKRGRKPAASPKGRGKKGSAAAKKSPKGRAGRKPAKSSASPTKTRPSRGQANKRMKYRERSDSEEEDSPVLSDSEVEEVMSESDVEEVDSGSDHGASSGKGRKRKAPQEKPKGRAAAGKSDSAKNGRGRKPSKAKKIESEDEEDMEEDIDEEEEDGGDSKAKDKSKGKSSRGSDSKAGGEKDKKKDEAKNGGSEGSGGSDQSGEEEEEDDEVPVKAKPEKEKPVAKSAVAEDKSKDKAKDKKEEEDDDEDTGSVGDGEESVKSSKSGKSDQSGKSDDSVKGEKVPKNPTETDYKSLSFDCDKKTQDGDAPNFRISSWNIGGIKSWIKKNGLEYLKRENPDVMCLQEIRSSEKTQPPEVKSIENYPHTYWSFSENAGHHGVGILSKVKPENVTYGLPIKDGDSDEEKKLKEGFNKEGRLLVAEYDKFILINAYVPNGGRAVKPADGNGKPYPPRVTNGERAKWDKLFREYVKQLDAKKPVVLAGDLNVAYEEIDLANPKTNTCSAGFTKEEREGFGLLLKETGVVDSFRELYGDDKGAYTFWSYMNNARAKNVGWRLDYFLLSTKLLDSLVDNKMRTKILGSDHCPITLFLHL